MIELFQVGDAVAVATPTGTWPGYIDRIDGREFWVRIDRPVPLWIKSDRSGVNRFGVTIKHTSTAASDANYMLLD